MTSTPTPDDDDATLLREVNECAAQLRQRLVRQIVPADISPRVKVPYKFTALRELLLHRVSDLSDAACVHYNKGSNIPAFVLTRAALETAAVIYHFNKTLESSLGNTTPEDLDKMVMQSLFGTKDKTTEYAAVNILTAVGHVEKTYPGVQEMFLALCEFAHPNCDGVMMGYQRLPERGLTDPRVPVLLGAEVAVLPIGFGLGCLHIAICLAAEYAGELAKKDEAVLRLCEAEERPDDQPG